VIETIPVSDKKSIRVDSFRTSDSPELNGQARQTLNQIKPLLSSMFTQQKVDVTSLVDQLLLLLPQQGLRCEREAGAWSIQTGSHVELVEAPPRQLSLVRSLCARLAVLSQETTGVSPFLYGGEGDIIVHHPDQSTRRYHVKTMNTTAAQWFEITPIKDVA